jgi:hypothetical protein
MIKDFLSSTKQVTHIYANGTSGDDANNGTIGSPVKSFTRVMALLPDVISHNTVVHMAGTFDIQAANVTISKQINNAYLLFDGGDNVVGGSLAISITSATTASITSTGAGWTVNQWAGFWAKLSDGTIRQIRNNTIDTIYVSSFFAGVPSGTFDIVLPETAITSTSSRIFAEQMTGSGYFYFQRVRFLGSSRLYTYSKGPQSVYQGVTVASSSIFATISWGYVGTTLVFGGLFRDPTDPTLLLSTKKAGISVFNGSFRALGAALIAISESYFNSFSSEGGLIYSISNGNNFKSILFRNTRFSALATLFADDGLGTSATNIIAGSAGVGLTLYSCGESPTIKADRLDISNCTSHAIEVKNASLTFEGVVSGSGNGGVGLYAHSGSQVTIAGATPPTVTGTDGDVAVNDPTIPDTWASVVAAGGLSSASEATLIKVS